MAVTLQYFFWSHPEWWSVGFCSIAWAVMLVHGWHHAGHEAHHWMTFAQELAYWMLMVAAMMLPLVMHSVRAAAAGSLWARRHRAIAGFLAGYFAPWLVLGMAAAGLRGASWTHTYAAPALGFVVAGLWQRTRKHKRALIACYRTRPLAPVGGRADRDCLLFGGTIGVACVRSCWPLMLACAFAGHGPIAMTGGMVVGALERFPFRPRPRPPLVGTLALASYYLVLAVLDLGFAMRAQQPPIPAMVETSRASFYLEKGTTHISLAMLAPTGPALLRTDTTPRGVLLKIENITSKAEDGPAGEWQVILRHVGDSTEGRCRSPAPPLPRFAAAPQATVQSPVVAGF